MKEILLPLLSVRLLLLAPISLEPAQDNSLTADVFYITGGFFVIFAVAHIALTLMAPNADRVTLPVVATLDASRLVMIHRLDLANDTSLVRNQIMWTVLSIALFIGVTVLLRNRHLLSQYSYLLGLGGLILLALPLVRPSSINADARIWISIGPFSMQPGEFTEVMLPIFLAQLLVSKYSLFNVTGKRFLGTDFPRVRDLGPILLIRGIATVIMVLQNDFGLALVLFGTMLAMLYAATGRGSWLIIGTGLVTIGVVGVYVVSGKIQTRVTHFLDPLSSYDEGGYQSSQGLFGMNWGGIGGTGLGQGYPQSIPVAHSDFILSAFGEELGFTGLSAITLLFVILISRDISASLAVCDPFGKLLVAGIVSSTAIQLFAVTAGVSELMPLTGLTTSFMSAGGSSLLASYIMLAIVLRVFDEANRPWGIPSSPSGLNDNVNASQGVDQWMNKTICQIFVVILGSFVLLLASLAYIQSFQEDKYAHNSSNSHQFLEGKSRPRGQIITDGDIPAYSVKSESSLYDRSYDTDSEAYAMVVGYLSDIYGSAGIEHSQNEILDGDDPSLFTSRASDMVTGKEPVGASTEPTLLPNAQWTVYQQPAERGYVSSIVTIRSSTGEILAIASTPSFNPSGIVASDKSTWQSLNNNEDVLLLNHATQRPLPSGSTFKVLTTITALEQGAPPDTSVTSASQITSPDTTTTPENYGGSTCGGATTTLRQALAQSCNTAFAELGMQYGTGASKDVTKRFGIGETHDDAGLPIQPSTVDEIPNQSSLGQTPIGQRDVSFTPLDNATIAAAIANGGVRMEPQITKSARGADLSEIKPFKPIEAGEAVSPEIAGIITELMRGSESHSDGNGSYIVSKTGTAEHGAVRGEYAPHVWYIVSAPDVDAAAAVVVENGGGQGQGITGVSIAAPIGRTLIDAVEQAGR